MLKYKRKGYQIIYDSNCFYNIIQPKRVVVNTIAACLKMLEMFINEHSGKLDFLLFKLQNPALSFRGEARY